MLADVRGGVFDPDATRSGYFHQVQSVAEAPAVEPVVTISDGEDVKVQEPECAAEDPEEDLDTGSSSDEEGADAARCSRQVIVPKAPEGSRLFQHVKTRMLHVMSMDHNRVFQCGRIAGDKHEVSRGDRIRWDTPCCGRCWKQAGHKLGPRLV